MWKAASKFVWEIHDGRRKLETEISKMVEQDGEHQWEARNTCTGVDSSNVAPDDARVAPLFCFTFARHCGVSYLPGL